MPRPVGDHAIDVNRASAATVVDEPKPKLDSVYAGGLTDTFEQQHGLAPLGRDLEVAPVDLVLLSTSHRRSRTVWLGSIGGAAWAAATSAVSQSGRRRFHGGTTIHLLPCSSKTGSLSAAAIFSAVLSTLATASAET